MKELFNNTLPCEFASEGGDLAIVHIPEKAPPCKLSLGDVVVGLNGAPVQHQQDLVREWTQLVSAPEGLKMPIQLSVKSVYKPNQPTAPLMRALVHQLGRVPY